MEWLGPYPSDVPFLSESHSIEQSDEEEAKGKTTAGVDSWSTWTGVGGGRRLWIYGVTKEVTGSDSQ